MAIAFSLESPTIRNPAAHPASNVPQFPIPLTGRVNGECMQIFLDEIAARYPNENVVMVLDGAGWHKSQQLELAENMRTVFLPPYSPELNPQEHVWDELREKFFHNRAFDSLEALEMHLEKALKSLELDHERMRSITGWDWIINSVFN